MVNKFPAMAYVGFLCAVILAIDLEDLYKMGEEDNDIVEKNEFIISGKVMTHTWGAGLVYRYYR